MELKNLDILLNSLEAFTVQQLETENSEHECLVSPYMSLIQLCLVLVLSQN